MHQNPGFSLSFLTGPEGGNTAEEDVQDDSGAPNVDLLPVAPAKDLRGHIIRAAHEILVHLPCGRRERNTGAIRSQWPAAPPLSGGGTELNLPSSMKTERPKSVALSSEPSPVLE